MKCAACGHENREGAKFCLSCGKPLVRACANCGAKLPAAAEFCDECGTAVVKRLEPGELTAKRDPRSYTPHHLAEKILQSKSVLEGERKQVTVLFADLKGSMDLGEKVDPEEWYRIMDRFFQILSDGVHRFEGTVEKFNRRWNHGAVRRANALEDHARLTCSGCSGGRRTRSASRARTFRRSTRTTTA
jgi:class 3 adenylate cyclase